MTCEAFWDAGVAEVFVAIDAAGQRLLANARVWGRVGISAAWYSEYFARHKRLPALEKTLERYDRAIKEAAARREPADQAAIDDWVAGRRKQMEALP